MRKHIPNLLTLLNLLSGCIAITMAFQGNFMGVVAWVLIAALFDFFDGFAARLLNAYSPLGKELDSLADIVSFGVAPSTALFILLRDITILPEALTPLHPYIPYLAFIIPLFSAYRLAKFNIDEQQTTSFLGLPTPANGLFWISYCHATINIASTNEWIFYLTIVLILILSPLMTSNIPMFSLKVKSLQIKGNEPQAILAVSSIVFLLIWKITGIAIIIIAYILLSLFTYRKHSSVDR